MNHVLRINADKHRDSSVSRHAITHHGDWLAPLPCSCHLPLRALPIGTVLNELCARVLPVAVTYADSGLAAAVATACSLALANRSAQANKAFFVVQS